MRVGVVVNPIAGMGGRVGLKGTDGKVQEAIDMGAEPWAPDRARSALETFARVADDPSVLVAAAPMGEDEARAVGLDPTVVYDPGVDGRTETTAADTRKAVETFVDRGVDLVLFAGGDGTAVDVASAIGDRTVPILGIPAGVKIYSGVFGATPADAGRIAASFERTAEREVNDIDEEAFRDGSVETTLEAIVSVPVADDVQATKQVGGGTVESLAAGVAADVEEGVTYIFGPGSTVAAIERALGVEGSPLGVDVWRDGELVVVDGTADEIREAIGEDTVIVVSPIGGQGFIFGRGNQQISPSVIRRSTLVVVASRDKLDTTGVLRVDTGDPDLDEYLRGWLKVRVGRVERRLVKVV